MSLNPKNKRRIASHLIYTPKGFLSNGIVTLDSDNVITAIDTDKRIDSLAGVEFYSGILLPGLVNSHCHLELSYLKGSIPLGTGFAGFAQALRAVRNKFTPDDQRAAARYWDARMWADGVSAVGDISNNDTTFGIKKLSPIRYHTFIEAYGLTTENTSGVNRFLDVAHHAGLSVSVTPHSTYSLNENLFKELLRGEGPFSIHFMESEGEKLLFEGDGALHEWYEKCGYVTDFCDKYSNCAQRVMQNTSGDEKMLLIHNNFVDLDEAQELIGHFGDNLTWILCPGSNSYMSVYRASAVCELPEAQIAIGSDSLASNCSLSLIDEIKLLSEIPLETALRWITSAGAKALGMEDELGSIETGKRPGLVLLTGVDPLTRSLTPDAATRRIV